MKRDEITALMNEQSSIILECMNELKKSDYVGIKIAEGRATKTEYRDKIELRQQWRDQINAAQEEIDRLKAIEPEDEPPLEPVSE